tara:strand:- start:84 stop:587 length:504 start_codon:yes stop_codon:yes gene_type:complete
MLIHYFNRNKYNHKNKANIIYKRILELSINFVKTNDIFVNKDFLVSFEIFSFFLIMFLKNFKDLKINNYKHINQELINIFIKDLDISFREQGIGDMNIGKFVKKFVKKFYFRVNYIENNINNINKYEFSNFVKNLQFIKSGYENNFSKKMIDKYKEIQVEIKSDYLT